MTAPQKAFWAVLLAIGLVVAVGCQTSGKALVTTVQTVDAAMKGWATYAELTNAPQAERDKVKAAYVQYQAAEALAEESYFASVAVGDMSLYKQSIFLLNETADELLNLIETFKRKGRNL